MLPAVERCWTACSAALCALPRRRPTGGSGHRVLSAVPRRALKGKRNGERDGKRHMLSAILGACMQRAHVATGRRDGGAVRRLCVRVRRMQRQMQLQRNAAAPGEVCRGDCEVRTPPHAQQQPASGLGRRRTAGPPSSGVDGEQPLGSSLRLPLCRSASLLRTRRGGRERLVSPRCWQPRRLRKCRPASRRGSGARRGECATDAPAREGPGASGNACGRSRAGCRRAPLCAAARVVAHPLRRGRRGLNAHDAGRPPARPKKRRQQQGGTGERVPQNSCRSCDDDGRCCRLRLCALVRQRQIQQAAADG